MKIIVACSGRGGPDDMVSPVFGRCQTFTAVTTSGSEILDTDIRENFSRDAAGSAGINATREVLSMGADLAMSGNFGPNVTEILTTEGIGLIMIEEMSVQEAVMKYLRGEIAESPHTSDPPERQDVRNNRFICPKCGCTMPGKARSMKCPNCGAGML